MNPWNSRPLVVWFALLAVVPNASAIPIVGMVDDFEDGTTQGWAPDPLDPFTPAPPSNQTSGGPGGVNDNFLLITALGGGGPGNSLNASNGLQWAGNYAAAGVDAITMDVRNFGQTELYLRLAFLDVSGSGIVNSAYSDTPAVLLVGSGWTNVSFSFSDLAALDGSVAGVLSNTTYLQLIHSPTEPISFISPYAEVGLLGVDNITATGPGPANGNGNGASVPDTTSSIGLLAIALLGLGLAKRKTDG